jgi:hypothetical protein
VNYSLKSISKTLNNDQNKIDLGALPETEIEQVGLLTMERNEQEIRVEEDIVSFEPNVFDPYPDQTPREVLERWRVVTSGNLTDGDVVVLNPAWTLLQDASVQAALATFRYFKSDWEIKVLLNSLPQQYGFLNVCHLPYMPDVADPWTNTYVAMDHNGTILDFSVQQEAIMTGKYLSPWQFWDLGTLASDNTPVTNLDYTKISNCHLSVIDSTVSATVPFQVWARFVNSRATGHCHYGSATPVAIAQSFKPSVPALAGTGRQGPSTSTFWKAAAIVSAVATASHSMTSQGQGGGGTAMESRAVPPASTPSVETASLANRAWGETLSASCVNDSNSLDYRGDSEIEADYGDDSVYHSLLSLVRKGSRMYYNSISTSGVTKLLIDTVNPAVALIAGTTYSTRLEWYSQFFRLWRGSIEYMFYFCSSPFYSSRWLITLEYAGSPASAMDGNILQYEVNVRGSTWVTVSVPYLYPTPWRYTPATDSEDSTLDPKLYLWQMTPPHGNGDQTPTTYVTVWKRAGPDFMLSSQRQMSVVQSLDATVVAEAQSFIPEMWGDPVVFGGGKIAPSYASQNNGIVLEQLLDRYSARTQEAFFNQPLSMAFTGTPAAANFNSQYGNFDLACHNFLFWKGSCKFKGRVVATGDNFGSCYLDGLNGDVSTYSGSGVKIGTNLSDGACVLERDLNPVFSVHVPYVNWTEVEFNANFAYPPIISVGNQAGPIMIGPSDTTQFTELFVASGPDFRLFYEYPPMYRPFWPDQAVLAPPVSQTSSMNEAKAEKLKGKRLRAHHRKRS